MADVRSILGVQAGSSSSSAAASSSAQAKPKKNKGKKGGGSGSRGVGRAGSLSSSIGGVNRSAARKNFGLASSEQLAPLVYTAPYQRKSTKRKIAPSKRWLWKEYRNSARPDNVKLKHWTRVDIDTQTVDYPYSRFNVGIVVPYGRTTDSSSASAGGAASAGGKKNQRYTAEEYAQFLQDPAWTKDETDYLFDLVERYDMRWPVIADRFDFQTAQAAAAEAAAATAALSSGGVSTRRAAAPDLSVDTNAAGSSGVPGALDRTEEDLKKRVFDVLVRLNRARNPNGTVEHLLYDYEYAVYRRQLLDRAFNRSEADRKEEQRLTAELAAISKELATVQKDVKSRYGLEDEIESAFDIQNEVEVSKVAQLPSYVAKRNYLRSHRLGAAVTKLGVGPRRLAKMHLVLQELGVREAPLATGHVCDMYDRLRQDILKLFALQRVKKQLERNVRLKVSPAPPPQPKPTTQAGSSGKTARSKSRKTSGTGRGKASAASEPSSVAATGAKKKKKSTARKKGANQKSTTTSSGSGASSGTFSAGGGAAWAAASGAVSTSPSSGKGGAKRKASSSKKDNAKKKKQSGGTPSRAAATAAASLDFFRNSMDMASLLKKK